MCESQYHFGEIIVGRAQGCFGSSMWDVHEDVLSVQIALVFHRSVFDLAEKNVFSSERKK